MSGATLLLGSTCNPASRDKFHSCSLAGYSDSPAVPCRLASLAKCQRTERTCLQTEAAQIRRNRLSIPSPRKSVPYKASIRYSSQINANELRLFWARLVVEPSAYFTQGPLRLPCQLPISLVNGSPPDFLLLFNLLLCLIKTHHLTVNSGLCGLTE